tara:strand:- start:366 stop:704 length:339 start_codon:yes stop_codon:yes gene_type:complete
MKKLIEQLERVNWTSFDKFNNTAIGEKDGKTIEIKMRWSFNSSSLNQNENAIDALLSIFVDGVRAYGWNLTTDNEQKPFAKWFLEKENELRVSSYVADGNKADEATKFFNAI